MTGPQTRPTGEIAQPNAPDMSAANWRKSTRSGPNGNCIEVALFDNAVALRDSKNPGSGALMFSPAAWEAFIDGTKVGDFSP